MNYKRLFLTVLTACICQGLTAQKATKTKESSTPYELMSSYYNEDFKPFKQRNYYVGLTFNLEDKQQTNTSTLLGTVIDGDRIGYDLSLKAGYYTGDYGMLGANFNYYESKFVGDIFRDPDTIQSNAITRGFSITPNFRSSVPLTENERLSFFTAVGLTFGVSNTLSRDIKNLDVVDKAYATDYNFRLGISPGITFFAIESFAFEVQLNVLGYELKVSEQSQNEGAQSREVKQNVDFTIDLFSLDLGLSYYFGAKK